MTGLLICTALGIEARAVRRGLAAASKEVQVMRTGPGPCRAASAAGDLPGYGALAVVGFGGALDPSLRPGDVLVAREVLFGDRVFACASAPSLAEELVRAGLPARTGRLLTCDHVVTGTERARLAAGGAHAVDMETGPLAAASAGRPLAAVRVIVDTPGAPLLSLATIRGGASARRALRRLGPALTRWASCVDPRIVRGVAQETIRFSHGKEVLS
ncbi:hypothetical protein AB0O34_08360 [Sphaerisporangium sp. NPDC088356]|uniref:phosphorylase family protein n=1 Tax=Sphaerisporangium sp. NPDC088356 TaxID=3154871 RepID=UPI003428415E